MLSHQQKPKKGAGGKGGRFLVAVTVMGSCGPIRFLVNEGDLVEAVIGTVLRRYAREGRFPALGFRCDDFVLYSAGSDALSPKDTISANGNRSFLLCKKQRLFPPAPAGVDRSDDNATSRELSRKWGAGVWKSWINKSFNLKIASH